MLRSLNLAVKKNCRMGVLQALKQTDLKIERKISPADATLYLKLFKKCLEENHADGSELWLNDVEEVTKTVELEVVDVQNGW